MRPMENWIVTWFGRTDWREAVISQPLDKQEAAIKIKIRPLQLKRGGLHAQFETFVGKQVFHENVAWPNLRERIEQLMSRYGQALISFPGGAQVHVTLRRDGKVKIQKNGEIAPWDSTSERSLDEDGVQRETSAALLHNRTKNRLIPEGVPAPFLVTLGVMKPDGSVVQAMDHK